MISVNIQTKILSSLIGEHDFYSFAKRDASMSSTLRTVVSCEILQVQPSTFGNKVYYLKIVGEGYI